MPDDFQDDTYLIRRKILTIFGAKFHVYNSHDQVVLFSQQKAFKLREDIRVYTDESMREERLLIRARQIVDFSAAYDVVDAVDGQKVGAVRRKGFRSILRDSWELLDAMDNPIAQIQEDSTLMAILRRTIGSLIPQKFHATANGRTLVRFRQHFNPFVLRLEVKLEPGADEVLDRRLILGAGILLAAIEGRQKS
ncbi:MAG: hypothetical protein RL885_31715 [Planctomycetota bacterium]